MAAGGNGPRSQSGAAQITMLARGAADSRRRYVRMRGRLTLECVKQGIGTENRTLSIRAHDWHCHLIISPVSVLRMRQNDLQFRIIRLFPVPALLIRRRSALLPTAASGRGRRSSRRAPATPRACPVRRCGRGRGRRSGRHCARLKRGERSKWWSSRCVAAQSVQDALFRVGIDAGQCVVEDEDCGRRNRARAIAERCFCPPDSVTPRSPTMVSKPCGNSSNSWRMCAASAASISSSASHPARRR